MRVVLPWRKIQSPGIKYQRAPSTNETKPEIRYRDTSSANTSKQLNAMPVQMLNVASRAGIKPFETAMDGIPMK